MVSDDELSRLAEQALLKEAKRGAQRAEVSGPSGWLKSKLPSTNKTFLKNTLMGAIASNRVKDKEDKTRMERGKRKRLVQEIERKTYKRMYIQASSKPKATAEVEEKTIADIIEKSTAKKVKTIDKNVFVWNEDGLDLKINNTEDTKEKLKGSQRLKHKTKVLPRNISFISSEKEGSSVYEGR